jgi:hypothetical protein
LTEREEKEKAGDCKSVPCDTACDHYKIFRIFPTLQQQLHPPPLDLGFENIERLDSSGFVSSQEIRRRIGVKGGVLPI